MYVLTESKEDYLEAIYVLSLEKKVIRIKDLANHLKVRMPSVISAVKNLAEKGLVRHEHYGYLELTAEGKTLAKKIYKRHKLLFQFLHNVLGIDSAIAEKDACGMEHHITTQTMERLLQFIKFVETCPEGQPQWLLNFYHFAEKGIHPESCCKEIEKRKDKK